MLTQFSVVLISSTAKDGEKFSLLHQVVKYLNHPKPLIDSVAIST